VSVQPLPRPEPETAADDPAAGPVGPPEAAPRLYLPELDGLRFFAFAFVFLFHQGVPWPQLAGLIGRNASLCFQQNGWIGVQVFFILSGYLIVTLLLREEAAYGRVDLRAFWVRRILRIWPLYYLTVVIVFLVIPGVSGTLSTTGGRAMLGRHLPAFLLFLGNWSMILRGPVWEDSQSVLWSVCVEEQFYLLVPLFVAFVGPRARVPVVVGLMAGSVAVRAALAHAGVNQLWVQYNTFAQFDTLLSGVLLALLLGTEPRSGAAGRWLRWLQWPIFAAAVWVFSRSNLGHGEPWRRTWDFVAIWLAGAGIVAVAVTVPGALRAALSYPRIVALGKISYGLYMYHEVAFWLKRHLADALGWFPNQEILLSIASFAMTVGLAAASYTYFERPFLRRKRGWTRVPSRPV
jgi:peptidoglycan/LPS O-acetylase OafA/YrhL